MEEENLNTTKGESNVKDLQNTLFPVSPRKSCSDSFLSNFFFKSVSLTDFDEDRLGQIIKFKESKEFYYSKDLSCSIQPPRWPTECQVLEEKIVHIPYIPSFAEPYYTPTGKEVQPKPVGEECGIVVYQYYPLSAVNYFSRSSVGGSKYLLPTCPCPEEDGLRFESRFESGNLAKAIKITATYYELYLRTDLYTNRHTQWFYFRISNMRKNIVYRFSIVNLSKDESLYNEGMKLVMYSVKDAQLHSLGWRRWGDNITYFCNENIVPDDPDQQMYYTLTFTMEFPHDDDTVYLAHSYPYTYSDLQDYLQELTTHPVKSTYTTLRLLCRTLAGNNVYYVTVTSPQTNGENKKRAVVITARVHPGETPSSWMMKGFLEFLTGDSGPAKELRDKFIFKLVPMLNPDGVIVGNNRCSLTGRDLNRQYRTVIRETYPSIWYTKLMIRRLLEECGVAMYCDLHAHSRKHNIFIYGCENRRGLDKRLHEQVFPLMLHKNAADKFSFENCKFRIQKCKEGTGRIVMWMMGIANSFTMEASFAGSLLGTRAESHFSTLDYEQMGRSFCQTLLDFYDDDPRKERLRLKIITRLMKEGSNADEPTNIRLSDYSSDSGDTSSSSEEGGGRDYEVPLVVPPPSPMITKKLITKPKRVLSKNRQNRSPNPQRKTLPMYKTTLRLSLSQDRNGYSSDSESSEAHSDYGARRKVKVVRRRRKKKKTVKKHHHPAPSQRTQRDFSDTEIQIRQSTERCISMIDMATESKIRSHSWHRSARITQIRTPYDSRRSTTEQLAEVQAKLISLRNKLWFGVGDNDLGAPLSWGVTNFSVTTTSTATQVQLKPLKQPKKKSVKHEKTEKKVTGKKAKNKEYSKEKSQKKDKQTGLKRQTAVEWTPLHEMGEKIRKVKSLTDASSKFQKFGTKCTSVDNAHAKQQETQYAKEKAQPKHKPKRKKKKSKLEKTAKVVTNANVFIRKD